MIVTLMRKKFHTLLGLVRESLKDILISVSLLLEGITKRAQYVLSLSTRLFVLLFFLCFQNVLCRNLFDTG